MHHLAYLMTCYILGVRYHSGQWSKGYELLCMAQERASREHSALDLGRQMENLADRNKRRRIYSPEYIKAVAFWMRKMRKYRHNL